MGNLTASYKLSGYRPILADNTENFKRYVQIRKKFEKNNLYRLFAEPKIDLQQGNAYWFTDWEGDVVSLSTFNEVEKEKHLTQLKYEVDFLFEECIKYQDIDSEYKGLQQTLEKCIEIPDFSCVYLVTSPDGERHYVLTMWGFIDDAFNAGSGLIKKIIPKNYKPLIIKAVYPSGHLAINETVSFTHSGITCTYTTNKEGRIHLNDVLLNSSVQAYQSDKSGHKRNVTNFNFTGQPEHEITVTGFAPMKFLVKDSKNDIKAGEKFNTIFAGQSLDFLSDTNGEFILDDVEVFTKITLHHIVNEGNKASKFEFSCDKRDGYYLIILPASGEIVNSLLTEFVLLDHKKNEIPNQEIVFTHNGISENKITSDTGNCFIENLIDKTKIKSVIRRGRRKHIKKTIYNKDINKYFIILKKRKPWWLLLFLLLLPLILLIPLKKDVAFKVLDGGTNQAVNKVHVTFCYNERYAFNFSNLRFFTKAKVCFYDSTDANGIVVFEDIQYSVYQWLFFKHENASAMAVQNCFSSDTVNYPFSILHRTPETILKLTPFGLSQDFLVVNKDNGEPLPGALVQVIIEETNVKKSDTTEVNGRVIISELPMCGKITVIGSCYGYYNDTISGEVAYLKDRIQARTLKLKPITRAITFYVKNLVTKQPLPGAKCQLYIEGRLVQETQTNTNGAVSMIGEATFENVHIIKEITIKASKEDYYDTTKTAIAQKFTDGGTEFRTLYLRPKTKPCDIRVIDATTSAPIAGAKAIIKIPGRSHKTEYSNNAGIVQISGLTGSEMISIVASKDPDYLPNNYTIVSKNVTALMTGPQSGRDIPLKSSAPPPIPCHTSSEGADIEGYDQTFEYGMGKNEGIFKFTYFTDVEPDAMYIYCGNTLVWSFDGATKKDTLTAMIKFDTPVVKVRIKGNSRWYYKVDCPE